MSVSGSGVIHSKAALASRRLVPSACCSDDRKCPKSCFGISFTRATLCLRGYLPCVCLCLSQVGILSKRLNESDWFWHGLFFPPIQHCCKEIQVPKKIKVLLSETLLQTLDLEKNFATAYRSLKRVINLARERWKSVLQLDLDQH